MEGVALPQNSVLKSSSPEWSAILGQHERVHPLVVYVISEGGGSQSKKKTDGR